MIKFKSKCVDKYQILVLALISSPPLLNFFPNSSENQTD